MLNSERRTLRRRVSALIEIAALTESLSRKQLRHRFRILRVMRSPTCSLAFVTANEHDRYQRHGFGSARRSKTWATSYTVRPEPEKGHGRPVLVIANDLESARPTAA
ncbi:hypothetical protein IG631_05622 [Alternaria alternata]|nr:hypothetical protein IG631_05622 [Alternaria alternata]